MTSWLWPLAVGASLILHALGLGAIALTTQPDPVKNASRPQSRLTIEAAEVARSTAKAQDTTGDTADPATTDSTQARQASIPQTHARAAPPTATKAIDVPPAAVPLAERTASIAMQTAASPMSEATLTPIADNAPHAKQAQMRPDRLAIVPPQKGLVIASANTAPTAARIEGRPDRLISVAPANTLLTASAENAPTALRAELRPNHLAALAAPNDILTPSAQNPPTLKRATPKFSDLSAREMVAQALSGADLISTALIKTTVSPPLAPALSPSGTTPPPITAIGQPVKPAQPAAQIAPDLPLPAIVGTAALAWSGSSDAPVSPGSLAAFAAFTQQGDLAAASAEVRDGIAGILKSVPCARLQTTFLPETGQLELRGHLPEDALRAPVLEALRAQVGDGIPISDQLLILPRPQCGALVGIAAVGLPQSTEQQTNPAVIGEDGFARNYTFQDGARLDFELTAPDYAAFVYFDYFEANGSVIHLRPNAVVPLVLSAAKSRLSLGKPDGDMPYLELTVSAPFGQEIAVVFASSVPLYDDLRPMREPAGPYLSFLAERVARARADHPDFKGEWVYYFISTRAR